VPAKFQRRRSPAAKENRPERFRGLGRSLLGVMCGSGLAGGGRMALNQGGGDGAEPRRRCSGMLAHRRLIRGGGKASGE
jgi:hypothetical protein